MLPGARGRVNAIGAVDSLMTIPAGSNDDAPNPRSRLKGMKQPALYAPVRLGMKIRLS